MKKPIVVIGYILWAVTIVGLFIACLYVMNEAQQ